MGNRSRGRALLAGLLAVGAVGASLPALVGAPAAASDAAVPATTAAAPFSGHGSIDEAYVLDATPGERLLLVNHAGQEVGSGTADRLGSLIFRTITPGTGYDVRAVHGTTVYGTMPFEVLSTKSTPAASFYADQHLHAGLNYITMRDGVKLAATVRLPPGKTLTDGPFPTVIEDSWYPIAGPDSLITSILHPNTPKITKTLLPTTATAVGSIIAPLVGFATVSLQMRGTGCSGGAFDLFGLPSTYDGYDAVQIVGSQPWVRHHKVGLVGISFSGISQLFIAGTDPPDLAAALPLSVTNDLYTTGFPGGIFNDGFAASWIAERVAAAKPAPTGGEKYAQALIKQGTQQCLANQKLRLQTQNVETLLKESNYRTPALYDQRSPEAWAQHIKVPVYIAGALEDEQTGPQWPAIISALSHDPQVYATVINGTHADSLGPAILSRWLEFMDIYVAGEVPKATPTVTALSGSLYQLLASAPSEPFPAIRFTTAPSLAAAKADFEKQTPRVRVLFDNGGGSAGPGALQPEWEADFTTWPPPKAVATTFDLGPGGTLSSSKPASDSTVSFKPNPTARPAVDLASTQNVWAPLPPYNWTPITGTNGVGFISPVLKTNVVVVGPASLNLVLKSTAADTDLQATVSEVLPDGKEMYVTSGFLRADDRALDAANSTTTHPVPTFLASTASPLPKDKFTLVRVPIDPIGFAFRAGSRIRITVEAPGGTRPEWAFDTLHTGGDVTDTVQLGGSQPSTVVLSVVPGITPPDPQPACPSLRGEPCRTYVPAGNGG
ncbi:MAG: CocE/NonD family hydrolase [Acidimicrobiales bacterium]